MAETFLEKACTFVEANKDKPFFLYYALHQPHVPRVPGPRFAGRSSLGPRGDVILELDWCVGELLATLERLGLRDKTIVIFTSDNGPVLDDGYEDRAVELNGGHRPAGPLRGGKYSMYDGGTRVPFIASWPGTIQPGKSDAVVCQVDFLASFASLVGVPLPDGAAVDSMDILPALLGDDGAGRTELVTEGIGAKTVLHQGRFVYIPPYKGSGGPQERQHRTRQLARAAAVRPGRRHRAAAQFGGGAPRSRQAMDRRLKEILAGSRTREPVSPRLGNAPRYVCGWIIEARLGLERMSQLRRSDGGVYAGFSSRPVAAPRHPAVEAHDWLPQRVSFRNCRLAPPIPPPPFASCSRRSRGSPLQIHN